MALIDEQKSTAEPPVEVEVRESLLESIASMSVVLVIGLFVMTFIFQNFVIPSASMVKTLLIGDHVLVDRTTLAPQTKWMPLVHYRSAKRGDIIVNGVAHNEAYAAMPAYDGDPNADRPRLSYVFQTSTLPNPPSFRA